MVMTDDVLGLLHEFSVIYRPATLKSWFFAISTISKSSGLKFHVTERPED